MVDRVFYGKDVIDSKVDGWFAWSVGSNSVIGKIKAFKKVSEGVSPYDAIKVLIKGLDDGDWTFVSWVGFVKEGAASC